MSRSLRCRLANADAFRTGDDLLCRGIAEGSNHGFAVENKPNGHTKFRDFECELTRSIKGVDNPTARVGETAWAVCSFFGQDRVVGKMSGDA